MEEVRHLQQIFVLSQKPNLYSSVPATIAYLVQSSFLPFKLDKNYGNIYQMNNFLNGGSNSLVLQIGTKTQGTFGVLHSTIHKTLETQIAAGDPPFLLEFTNENEKVGFPVPFINFVNSCSLY